MLDKTEPPLAANNTPATKFTEGQARDWLSEHADSSVRQAAAAWSWHPSKVYRFLRRVRSETPSETLGETPSETPDVSRGTPRTLGVNADFTSAPYRDNYDWPDEDLIQPEQQRLAVYRNCHGNIVLRSLAWPDEDNIIIVGREHVEALVARLRALAKPGGAS